MGQRFNLLRHLINYVLRHLKNYVLSKYGEAAVVFDGYDATSTKYLAHTRCNKGKLGPLVTFTPEMCLTSTKEQTEQAKIHLHARG